MVLLAELSAARELVAVEDAVDVGGAHRHDEHRAGRLRVGAARQRRVAAAPPGVLRRGAGRAPPQIARAFRRVAPPPGGLELAAVRGDRDDDVVGLEDARGDARDERRERVAIGGRVDVAQRVEQVAEPIALDERRGDEVDEIVDDAIELAERGRGRDARGEGRDARPLDERLERLVVAAPDVRLEIVERALGLLDRHGERADDRAARPLERLDARRHPLGHHAVEDAPAVRAEAGADGAAIAPRRRFAERELRATEPQRRRVVVARGGAGRDHLGEPDHRAPLVALQTGGGEHVDGRAHPRVRVVRVSDLRGVEAGLELDERHEARRRRDVGELVRPFELRARRGVVLGDARRRRALERELGAEVQALARVDRVLARVVRVLPDEGRGRPPFGPRDARLDHPRARRDARRLQLLAARRGEVTLRARVMI